MYLVGMYLLKIRVVSIINYVYDNWNGQKVSVPGLSNGDCVFYDNAKTMDEVWHELSWEQQNQLRSEGW